MRKLIAIGVIAVALPLSANAGRADTYQPAWQVSASASQVTAQEFTASGFEPATISTDRPVLGAIIDFLKDIRERWGRG